ncbi:hypothetical protein [Burkholderia sp. GS2Y]|uniref:Uncharacterized protein n=1 Tax=Burkholderia theae TaxID=3143496 RepID=A0ABU9WXF2_9BURK
MNTHFIRAHSGISAFEAGNRAIDADGFPSPGLIVASSERSDWLQPCRDVLYRRFEFGATLVDSTQQRMPLAAQLKAIAGNR